MTAIACSDTSDPDKVLLDLSQHNEWVNCDSGRTRKKTFATGETNPFENSSPGQGLHFRFLG